MEVFQGDDILSDLSENLVNSEVWVIGHCAQNKAGYHPSREVACWICNGFSNHQRHEFSKPFTMK